MHPSRATCLVAATLLLAAFAQPALAIVGSDGPGDDPFNGLYINDFLGATTFYNNGFSGQNAVIANIEAGVGWNGHETLQWGQVAQYFADPSITSQPGWSDVNSGTLNAWTDIHATWTAQVLVGNGFYTFQQGMAPNATLWCGAIATDWISAGTGQYTGSFDISTDSVTTPYYQAMVGGVNGRGTADVINSSWGGSDGQDGNEYVTQMLDNLAWRSGKIVCLSAGNDGSGTNTVSAPATGFNTIAVGATSPDTSNYNAVADFSSRSPNDVFDPSLNGGAGGTVPGARASVDLVAPGDNLTLAAYGGPTGGAQYGFGTFSGNDYYYIQVGGTSFSSPTVAGGAALVVDAGKSLYANNPHAIDGRVVKALLMNSATKLPGWDNGQTMINGVLTTTQSLDYTQGAGQLNLSRAWTEYTAGTADVPGLGGGSIDVRGWDYGTIPANGHNDYMVNQSLPAGVTFTLTLSWFAHSYFDVNTQTTGYGAFDNLDLQVYCLDANGMTLVAQSISKYNSTEQLSFVLPETGDYIFRVLDAGYNWNGINGITDTTTDYGFVWDEVATPEPASGGCVLLIASFSLLKRRRN